MEVTLEGTPTANAGLDYARKLCGYRFLQETLSNAARHSGSNAASVHVEHLPEALSVAVCDTGRGFEPATAQRLRQDGGQGFLGLTDRAESLGGTIEIESAPGLGARITLTLPSEETSS